MLRAPWCDDNPPPLPAASYQHPRLARLLLAHPSPPTLLLLFLLTGRVFEKGLAGQAPDQDPRRCGGPLVLGSTPNCCCSWWWANRRTLVKIVSLPYGSEQRSIPSTFSSITPILLNSITLFKG
ncbi:hypothetical protein V6N13_127863 [Hibiscus sabdariffa]